MSQVLEQAAIRYADLIRDIAIAERKTAMARADLDSLISNKNSVALTLREYVGANVRRKAVTGPNGVIITIEFISENVLPAIHVYQDGEEIT